MEYCYKIFSSDAPEIVRRFAVILLIDVSDESVLGWLPEFLADPGGHIPVWGAKILEQLARSEMVIDREDDAKHCLDLIANHANPIVAGMAAEIRSRLQEFLAW